VKAQAEAKREGIPWKVPKGLCVYDLRHAFGTYAYWKTGDIRAVAELMLHSDIRMTQRYTEAGVSATVKRAIGLMED
jgi:site-specific recombinase XerC